MTQEFPVRMWINQPSRYDPLHHLDGTNVLAVKENNTTMRIYFLKGQITSMQVSPRWLSRGWRKPKEGQPDA